MRQLPEIPTDDGNHHRTPEDHRNTDGPSLENFPPLHIDHLSRPELVTLERYYPTIGKFHVEDRIGVHLVKVSPQKRTHAPSERSTIRDCRMAVGLNP